MAAEKLASAETHRIWPRTAIKGLAAVGRSEYTPFSVQRISLLSSTVCVSTHDVKREEGNEGRATMIHSLHPEGLSQVTQR